MREAHTQATEFASIVSVLRRTQRVWGRILTVSGAVCAFCKSAMVDVGLFDPKMATEDIALTWKLQRRFYDVRYEPRAAVAMQVPETLRGLYHQRKRWATGLAQVLRRNAPMLRDWRTRRLWPVFVEAVLSVTWTYLAVGMICFWALSYLVGLKPLGANPVPNYCGHGDRHDRARAARRRRLARPPLQPWKTERVAPEESPLGSERQPVLSA